jgi:hypothetical protein
MLLSDDSGWCVVVKAVDDDVRLRPPVRLTLEIPRSQEGGRLAHLHLRLRCPHRLLTLLLFVPLQEILHAGLLMLLKILVLKMEFWLLQTAETVSRGRIIIRSLFSIPAAIPPKTDWSLHDAYILYRYVIRKHSTLNNKPEILK